MFTKYFLKILLNLFSNCRLSRQVRISKPKQINGTPKQSLLNQTKAMRKKIEKKNVERRLMQVELAGVSRFVNSSLYRRLFSNGIVLRREEKRKQGLPKRSILKGKTILMTTEKMKLLELVLLVLNWNLCRLMKSLMF